MPRFYFDIREGTRFVPDDEGLVYPDLDTAERMAAETARALHATCCREARCAT
jgi:hypothetical protein